MQEIQNKLRIKNKEYKFKVDEALDPNSENPVTNRSLYEQLTSLAPFKNLELVTDLYNTDAIHEDTMSDSVPTVGAVLSNFAKIEYNTRFLKDFTIPNRLILYDFLPGNGQNNTAGTSRFKTPSKAEEGNLPSELKDKKGRAWYYVVKSGDITYGYLYYTYDIDSDGNFQHCKIRLSPYNVYYADYHSSTDSKPFSSGFYYTNMEGVLQLKDELSTKPRTD